MKNSILALCAFTLLFISCKKNENTAGTESKTETAAIAHPKPPTAVGTPRILFIGNSHIDFYVSLPTLLEEFCKANNTKMETEELVEMGISIEEIYNTDKEKAEKMFGKTDTDQNYYDYVVIQEKTPVAMQEAEKYKTSVKMMVDKIRKNSPGVAVYIYEVMSPEDYAANKDDFNTYQKEMKDIALQVMKDNSNTGLFRVSDAIKDA